METKLDTDVITISNAFTESDIRLIHALGMSRYDTGVTDMSTGDTSKRKTWHIAIPKNPLSAPIFDKVGSIIKDVNSRHWNFEIEHFNRAGLYYACYDNIGDHYGWHTDKTEKYGTEKGFVKIAAILQLTDPWEYTGANLQCMTDGLISVPKQKGLFMIMPGWVTHQVTPIQSGVRKSMIVWMMGPPYK